MSRAGKAAGSARAKPRRVAAKPSAGKPGASPRAGKSTGAPARAAKPGASPRPGRSPAKPPRAGKPGEARRAVVLLSGGLDSATAAAVARSRGFILHALTADYGQRHSREIESAVMVGQSLRVREHRIVRLPVGGWGGSSLTDDALEIPRGGVAPGIPSTYVPARNLVLLAVASSFAEAVGADAVFIGATQVDYSGYPDCRGDFISSFERTLALGTRRGREGRPILIEAPLLDMPKDAIIRLGLSLGVDYSLTWSCYSGGASPCGGCDSCRFRAEGFAKAGAADPLVSKSAKSGRGGARR